MLVGYARDPGAGSGFEAQQRELKDVGCENVFSKQVSSVAKREQLDAALDYVREGDVLVMTKLDRLARSVRDLVAIKDTIVAKGASLRILGHGARHHDTDGPADAERARQRRRVRAIDDVGTPARGHRQG